MIHLTDRDIRRFWANVTLPDQNGCMLWTGSSFVSGYGRLTIASKGSRAHRVSLFLAEGLPPADKPESAHGCRNRLCVAPDHLRWASRKENSDDRRRDGTVPLGERNGQAKLTSVQVSAIRAAYSRGSVRQVDLAKQYGVGQTTISQIVTGMWWR